MLYLIHYQVIENVSDVVGPAEEELVEVLLEDVIHNVASLIHWEQVQSLVDTPESPGSWEVVVNLQSHIQAFDEEWKVKVAWKGLSHLLNWTYPLHHQTQRTAKCCWIVGICLLKGNPNVNGEEFSVPEEGETGFNEWVRVVNDIEFVHFNEQSSQNLFVARHMVPLNLVWLHSFVYVISPPLGNLEEGQWPLLQSGLPLVLVDDPSHYLLGFLWVLTTGNLIIKVFFPVEELLY